MTTLTRSLLLVAVALTLTPAGRPASAQGSEEGWQVFTRDKRVNDVLLELGGALGGGYTWSATEGGVICHSDSQQVKFTTADGLVNNAVFAIAADQAGRLWFATGGGVSMLDHAGTPLNKADDTWESFTTADGLAYETIRAVHEDSTGRLWFGTYGGGSAMGGASVLDHGGTPFEKADDTWISFNTPDGLAHPYVCAITADGSGRIWFGTYGGVSVLDHGGTLLNKGDDIWATFTTTDGLVLDYVWDIVEDGNGRLWFGASMYGEDGGVSVLDYGATPFQKGDDTWGAFKTTDGLAANSVMALAQDENDRMWFGTYRWLYSNGDGVSLLDDGGTPFDKGDDTWTTFTTGDGLVNDNVLAISLDSAGRSWFGTGSGVSALDANNTPFDQGDDTWIAFTSPEGLVDNNVESIVQDSSGRWWFGTWGGVSVLNHNGTPLDQGDDDWVTFTVDDGLANYSIYSIAIDSEGRHWFGVNSSGLNVLDYGSAPFDKGDDTWGTFTTADGMAGTRPFDIAIDGEGRIWTGLWGGIVSVLDYGDTPFDKADDIWISFTTTDGLPSNVCVRGILVEDNETVWFGLQDGGVAVLDHGGTLFNKDDDTWTSFSDFYVDDHVWDLTMDQNGLLWFGTSNGATVLDDGGTPTNPSDDQWRTFSSSDGLPDDRVNTVAVDSEGRLWFGTGGGVGELDHSGTPFDTGDDSWTTFTTADGLAGNDIHAISAAEGGNIWFGTFGRGVGELVDTAAPLSLANSPDYDTGGSIPVSWSASDGGSGILGTTLWAKHNGDGMWANTSLTQIGSSGVFHFTPGQGEGTYYFASVARDWLGNAEAVPNGAGDDSTIYDTSPPTASASSPETTDELSFLVNWSGYDGTSGIASYDVQYRMGSGGAWHDWRLTTVQTSATFGPTSPVAVQEGQTYYFRARARDQAGNLGTYASGGDCATRVGDTVLYLPLVLRNLRTWDAYYEENDHWLVAYGPLAFDQVYQAYPNDTDDYYYFQLPSAATVNISLEDFAPTSSFGDLLLYGPAIGDERGPLITYFGQPGHSSMVLGPESLGPGKYYIRVYVSDSDHFSSGQLYTLTVSR